jgi:predicted Zn-dependent protease
MKSRSLFSLVVIALTAPALFALDFGGLTKGLDTLKKGVDTAKDASKIAKAAGIGPKEERSIGDSVALEILSRYGGLVRDEGLMRRVNLVGLALARASDRPDLEWRFGVLDSDTVNAFSAPGGYVFISRGLYDLAASDDVLAGILGHEIAHITRRHALKIVERTEAAAGAKSQLLKRSNEARAASAQMQQINAALGADISGMLKTMFVNGFDAPTEYEADQVGRALAVTNGFAPGGLRAALAQLQARGENRKVMFSTHPPLAERLKRLPNEPAPVAEAAITDAENKPAGEPK